MKSVMVIVDIPGKGTIGKHIGKKKEEEPILWNFKTFKNAAGYNVYILYLTEQNKKKTTNYYLYYDMNTKHWGISMNIATGFLESDIHEIGIEDGWTDYINYKESKSKVYKNLLLETKKGKTDFITDEEINTIIEETYPKVDLVFIQPMDEKEIEQDWLLPQSRKMQIRFKSKNSSIETKVDYKNIKVPCYAINISDVTKPQDNSLNETVKNIFSLESFSRTQIISWILFLFIFMLLLLAFYFGLVPTKFQKETENFDILFSKEKRYTTG